MQSIWIEFPATDINRAKAFYQAVFQHAPTDVIADGTRKIAVIAGEPTVSLTETSGFTPTVEGSLPYFHVDAPLSDTLSRVSSAGGRVVEPAAARGENGVFSMIVDTEGNALYLHSAN